MVTDLNGIQLLKTLPFLCLLFITHLSGEREKKKAKQLAGNRTGYFSSLRRFVVLNSTGKSVSVLLLVRHDKSYTGWPIIKLSPNPGQINYDLHRRNRDARSRFYESTYKRHLS